MRERFLQQNVPIELAFNRQMNQDFLALSLEQLQELYEKAEIQLKQSLLNGTSWNEVKDKRLIVTKLAKEIWKKRVVEFSSSTPADTPLRAD